MGVGSGGSKTHSIVTAVPTVGQCMVKTTQKGQRSKHYINTTDQSGHSIATMGNLGGVVKGQRLKLAVNVERAESFDLQLQLMHVMGVT